MGRKRKPLTEKELPDLSIYEANGNYFLRLVDQFNKRELGYAAISFEALVALYLGDPSENDREELIRHLPVSAWREDTVPVPRELLRPLVEGWRRYRENIESVGAYDLGQMLGIEGKTQGKEGAAKVLARLNRDTGLANKVTQLDIEQPDKSLDEIYAIVAVEMGLSADTVRNAYRESRLRRDAIIAHFQKG